jgi:hypothetical protein
MTTSPSKRIPRILFPNPSPSAPVQLKSSRCSLRLSQTMFSNPTKLEAAKQLILTSRAATAPCLRETTLWTDYLLVLRSPPQATTQAPTATIKAKPTKDQTPRCPRPTSPTGKELTKLRTMEQPCSRTTLELVRTSYCLTRELLRPVFLEA